MIGSKFVYKNKHDNPYKLTNSTLLTVTAVVIVIACSAIVLLG